MLSLAEMDKLHGPPNPNASPRERRRYHNKLRRRLGWQLIPDSSSSCEEDMYHSDRRSHSRSRTRSPRRSHSRSPNSRSRTCSPSSSRSPSRRLSSSRSPINRAAAQKLRIAEKR